jgi:hypothetical protein
MLSLPEGSEQLIGTPLERVLYFSPAAMETAWLIRSNLERADLACELKLGAGGLAVSWQLRGGLALRSSVSDFDFLTAKSIDVTMRSPNWRRCLQAPLVGLELARAEAVEGNHVVIDLLVLRFEPVVAVVGALQYLDYVNDFAPDADELSIAFAESKRAALATLGLRGLR